MNILYSLIQEMYVNAGVMESMIPSCCTATLALLALAICGFAYWLISGPVCSLAGRLAKRTDTKWDDRLLSPKVMHPLALLLSAVFLVHSTPAIFYFTMGSLPLAMKVVRVGLIIAAAFFVNRLITVVYNGMRQEQVDISGLAVLRNIITAVLTGIAILMILSVILSKNIAYLLSGLGAMAAVLSLVFKESLLGMTAGVRLVVNKMLKHNDWIRVPAKGIDGRITDITLTTVKVRNWDNSISTIPPHTLMSEGFCNMEAMLNQGSRRLMRSLHIDINSIRNLTSDELRELAGEEWAKPYISSGKYIANITLWRHYMEHAIERHPLADLSMRRMVRELQPEGKGLPVELFFFLRIPEWEIFESAQADFIDDAIAAARNLHLRIFQTPAGSDISLAVSASPHHKTALNPVS